MRQKRSVRAEQDVRLRYAKQPKPSIPCPECGYRIEIDLFKSVSGSCRKCGIDLKVKESDSREALDSYRKMIENHEKCNA